MHECQGTEDFKGAGSHNSLLQGQGFHFLRDEGLEKSVWDGEPYNYGRPM